jgi:hypothetical protein
MCQELIPRTIYQLHTIVQCSFVGLLRLAPVALWTSVYLLGRRRHGNFYLINWRQFYLFTYHRSAQRWKALGFAIGQPAYCDPQPSKSIS